MRSIFCKCTPLDSCKEHNVFFHSIFCSFLLMRALDCLLDNLVTKYDGGIGCYIHCDLLSSSRVNFLDFDEFLQKTLPSRFSRLPPASTLTIYWHISTRHHKTPSLINASKYKSFFWSNSLGGEIWFDASLDFQFCCLHRGHYLMNMLAAISAWCSRYDC